MQLSLVYACGCTLPLEPSSLSPDGELRVCCAHRRSTEEAGPLARRPLAVTYCTEGGRD
jgi:hypothetical protein